MAREKATLTVDRAKLEEARRLTGAKTSSEAVDIALTGLIRDERLRRDVAAYARRPATVDEIALSRLPIDHSDIADDTDWDALYAEDRP